MTAQTKTITKEAALLTRHTDAKFLNHVINDPSVVDWVRGPLPSPLDLSPIVEDISNIALMGEHGGMVFIYSSQGSYEIHTQVLPSGRGKWCLKMSREALRWMFTRTSAMELTTRVPLGNLGALTLVRANGLHEELKLSEGWIYDGKPVPATVYSLSAQDWVRSLGGNSSTVATGKWFMERLEQEYLRQGSEMAFGKLSEPDLAHVGASMEMILGGQKHKGVIFYNRWAKMVGVSPISIVTLDPLVIECSGALLKFRSTDFWVMSCPLQYHS